MLEIKHLSKIYKSKNNIVKALDDINLTIQDKGMIFILGKSGSGKSTLLNVLGGLDQFDEGEIIICGKSSKDFKQSDFDSYRNTFIGFIFQEYNVMENFTVKENIALALQLQGKKATNEAIQDILKQVDLENLGDRKPNELSGGQLQRVAIARALIKNPEIIMADEPTGALDSKTGKQVFETLKKLSQHKLVLIVSHDKEFAKNYADRIIELSDGKIISDTSKETCQPDTLSDGVTIVDQQFINIQDTQSLSQQDIQKIIDELKKHSGETIISFNKNTNSEIKKVNHIDENGSIEVFHPTTDQHLHLKDYTSKTISFIKSKLPFKSSMKLALSNLKLKPFRLFMTIMLSVVSFTLFGLTNTLSQYNKNITTYNSVKDSQIDYLSISKNDIINYDDENYSYESDAKLNTSDIQLIQDKYKNIPFIQTFDSSNDGYSGDLSLHLTNTEKMSETEYRLNNISLSAYASLNEDIIKKNGFTLKGKLPSNNNEIVITEYIADSFKKFGYSITDSKGQTKNYKIQNSQDLIGKKLNVTIHHEIVPLTITGILDTHIDLSRYQSLTDDKNNDGMSSYILESEFMQLAHYGYHSLGYVNNELLQDMISTYASYPTNLKGYYLDFILDENYYSPFYFYNYNDLDKDHVIEFNNNGQVYVSYDAVKDIKIDKNMTIEDYVNSQITQPDNEKEMMKAINNAVKKYQSKIITSPFKISYSNYDDYKENSIDKIAVVFIEISIDKITTFALKEPMIQKYHLEKEGYSKYIVAPMTDDDTLKEVISYTYDDGIKESNYALNNQVMPMIVSVNSVVDTLASVFLVGGVALAIFASVMFCNFIATSIANKKREIGILRAVGARGLDVLKIFLNESLIIAIINWLLAVIVCLAGTNFMNHYIRTKFNVLVTILDFGPLQIIVILIISIAVAFIASALPVFNISRKKPIDAIKNRK